MTRKKLENDWQIFQTIGKWSNGNCPKEHLGENCLAVNYQGGNSRELEMDRNCSRREISG